MDRHTQLIVDRIQQLRPLAPHDWKKTIAQKINVTESTVYSYSVGRRKPTKGMPALVLRYLEEIIAEKEKEILLLVS